MAVTAATRESIIDLVTIAYDSSAGTALLNELVALSEAGQTLKQIANYIADSSTYKAIYPPFLTNQEWATAFVNVILEETSSAGKSEGVNLIVSFLNAGSTRGDILWEASAYLAAPTSAADPVFGSAARAFNNITEVSTYYTVILNLDGTLSQRQAAVENVSSDPVTVTEAKAAADVVADPLYTLSVDSPTLVEPSAGTRVLTYTLTLNKAATETVSINYNTLTSGTASAGNDFLADSGVVTFAAGQTTAAVGVTVNADTTFETSETVQIQFTGSQLSSSVTATGTITDANVAPVITSGATGSVAENADIATVIYTAAASDADAGDTQVYSLKAGGDAAMLDINSATGAVSLKASADFETKNAYSFTIVATDQGGLTSEKAVTAGVTDVNEAPVVSSGATGTVAENAVASTVVYTATASDVDAGDTHTFSLKAGGDAAMLSIDAATGAVTLNASADFETKAAYDFTVVATDKAGLAGEKAVTVSVTDANDAPVITSGATGSVAENAAIATAIYTAAATDQDAGDTLAFSLKAGDDAALLDIDSATGAVTLKASANFEAKASYGFTVVATDTAGASAEQAVVAAVTDVNEAPTGLADTSATSDNTTVTISVLANDSDPDAGDVLSVASVTQGSNGTVAIVGDKVTYTPNSTFLNGTDTFTYIAQDSGGLQTAAQTVSVTVNTINNAPVITAGQAFSVTENVNTSGLSVGFVAAVDEEGGTAQNWTITDGNAAGNFAINKFTGEITQSATANFDFETTPSYTLTLTATDGANLQSAAQTVTIAVTDANDTAPVVTSGATAAVAENILTTDTVYQVTTTDGDATNGTTTYTLGGADAALFAVSATGAVTFVASPNFEVPTDAGADNVYNITVTANDGVNNSAAQAVAITVTNVNDVAPVITSAATANFAENTAIATAAYTVVATDGDAGTAVPLVYSVSGTDAALFDINSSTGTLTFKSSPNFEAPADAGADNVYDVTVSASDGVTTAASQAVAISVTNVNEAPVAVNDSTTASTGQSVTIDVVANDTDPDAGTTLTPTIDVGSLTKGGSASVVDGKIVYNSTVGFAGTETFTYKVSDGTTTSASATVTVVVSANTGGTSGDDALYGTSSAEVIDGLAGNDTIIGGGGADTINGGDGNDTITFHDSAPVINGGAGLDVLVVNGDAIAGTFDLSQTGDQNTDAQSTTGIVRNFENMDATKSANTITLTADNTGTTSIITGSSNDTLTFTNATASSISVTANGGNDTINIATALTGKLNADAGDGNDTYNLNANTLTHTLNGGAGNDTFNASTAGASDNFSGGAGNDTFVYSSAGNLTVADTLDGGADTDRIYISQADTSFSTTGLTKLSSIEEIVINDESADGGETITITNDAFGGSVSTVFVGAVDASASTTTLNQAFTLTVTGVTAGTVAVMGTGAVAITNGASAKVSVKDGVNGNINLGTGGQSATGGTGNDTITGGSGNDTISGGAGNDLFDDFAGEDSVDGGAGNDTFSGAAATITAADTLAGGEGTDRINITDEASFSTSGLTKLSGIEEIVINDESANGGETLTITNDAFGGGVSTVFVGARDLNASATTLDQAFTLTVTGVTAGTVAVMSTGAVAITNGASAKVSVKDGVNGNINLGTGGQSATGGTGNDTITGGSGNDTISGGAGNDVFDSLAGSDSVDGGEGNDIFTDSAANITSADTLTGGAGTDRINISDEASFSTNGLTKLSGIEEYVINDESANGGETLTITNDAFGGGVSTVFVGARDLSASATTLDKAFTLTVTSVTAGTVAVMGTGAVAITNGANAKVSVKDGVNGNINLGTGGQSATGGTGNDTITGGSGNDTISGGAGNDTFDDFAGEDSVDGGAGNDTFTVGTGLSASDTINGGEGTDTMTVTLNSTVLGAATVTAVETITINTGANQTGTFTATNVASSTAINVEDGGTADNAVSITGLTSGMTISLQDVGNVGGGADFADNVTVGVTNESTGTSDSVTVKVNSGAAFGLITTKNLETLNLEVGAIGNQDLSSGSDIQADTINVTSSGTTTNNLNLGTLNAEVTTVSAGSFKGALTATTGTGSQTITGGDGADVLSGGAGTDSVSGGAGSDTITIDSVTDIADGGAGTDTLTISFNGVGGAIIIDLSATDQVTNMNGQSNSAVQSNFENVNVAGYTNSAGADITGSSAANSITGTSVVDVITGGEGADTIIGGTGIDSITLTETTSAADNVQLNKTLVSATTADYDTITGFAAGTDNIVTLDTDFAFANGATDGAVVLATGADLDAVHTADNDFSVGTISTNITTNTLVTFLAGTSTYAQLLTAAGTAMGTATDANFANSDKFLVAIDDGTHTGIFLVESAGDGNAIANTEVSLIGILKGVNDATTLAAGDFLFA